MEDPNSAENIDRLGFVDVSNFRQKPTAEERAVNQCTADSCLKFEISTHATYLYFQQGKGPQTRQA